MPQSVGPLRILDLSRESLAISHATSLLATWGARVWKVEDTPAGDPLRRWEPVVQLSGGHRASIPFLFTCRGKSWIGVRGEVADSIVQELAAAADIVLLSAPADYRRYTGRKATILVTPFGTGGICEDWKAGSFGLFHASGLGYVTPRAAQSGSDQSCPPQAPWGYIAEYFGGLYVANTVLAATLGERTISLDISLQECLLPLLRRETAAWIYDAYVANRRERLWRVAPSGFYELRDGRAYASIIEDGQWRALCRLMDREDLLADSRFATPEMRFEAIEHLDAALSPWFGIRSRDEVFTACGQQGIPVGPVYGHHDLQQSPHLQSRAAFETLPDEDLALPRIPIRECSQPPEPAAWQGIPAPGRDTEHVLAEVGWSNERIAAARASGTIFTTDTGKYQP